MIVLYIYKHTRMLCSDLPPPLPSLSLSPCVTVSVCLSVCVCLSHKHTHTHTLFLFFCFFCFLVVCVCACVCVLFLAVVFVFIFITPPNGQPHAIFGGFMSTSIRRDAAIGYGRNLISSLKIIAPTLLLLTTTM